VPPPPEPPPTQYLRPPFHEEEDKVKTLEQQRARSRKAGAEKRRLDAQFTEKDLAAIAADRDSHPYANNNTDIAKRLQDNPATAITYPKKGRRVPYTVPELARKIGREHPRK
jgi:hypothetical protein